MSVAQRVKWSKWQFTSGFGKYPKLSYIRICLNFFSKICFYRTLWRKPTSFWGRSPADPQYVTTHPRWILAIFKILKYCKWNPLFFFLTPHYALFSRSKIFLKRLALKISNNCVAFWNCDDLSKIRHRNSFFLQKLHNGHNFNGKLFSSTKKFRAFFRVQENKYGPGSQDQRTQIFLDLKTV